MPRRLALLATALVGGLVGAAPAARAASLTFRPAVAPPGATVFVEGAGFDPGASVAVTAHRRTFLRAGAGADGSVKASFVLPRGIGRRPQTFQTRSRRLRLTNVVRVVPSVVDWAPREVARSNGVRVFLSRTVAFPTAPVLVIVYGVKPRAVVSASLVGGPPVRTRADRSGRALLRLTVPTTKLDTSAVNFSLGRGRVRVPFYVLPPTTIAPPLPQPLRAAPIMGAAGDIACRPDEAPTPSECQQQATSDVLLAAQPDVVAELGDPQYDNGAADEFPAYDATWGRLRDRTRPAIGNHEYRTDGAAPYFTYFGAAAGEPGRGYYSYDVGTWHVVVLNANCVLVACFAGSLQEVWLRADLAAHSDRCTLAYWHQPRFSSAQTRSENLSVQALWQDLQDAGADVVLTGHVHNYERFAPQSPTGQPDPNGIREFVVGTGGRDLQPLRQRRPNSEAQDTTAFGVLFITLRDGAYDWRFVSAAGGDFSDAGLTRCH